MIDRRIAASLLVATVLLAAACTAGPGAGGQLEGIEWVLRSYARGEELVVVPETEYADARFDRQRVTGVSGCNRFDALYRTGGRTLLITQPVVTRMACDQASMAFEGEVLANLDASRHYGVRGDVMTIYGARGTTLLVYDAAPKNPLLGTWDVDSLEIAETVATVPEDSGMEVVFGLASVGGFAGCNSFSGTYGTNGTVVRISRLATTQVACAADVTARETALLEALQGAALLDRQGATMLLTDLSGSVLMALKRPVIEEAPAASPTPSGEATASPEPSATIEPTESPIEATAAPAPTPTPAPTPAPTAAPTSAPSVPPIILPTVATCELLATDGSLLATLVYPGGWETLSEPQDLACRYFDPDPITVPGDPATLTTAVMIAPTADPYAEVVADATDPASWTVREQIELTVDGLPATMIEAEATSDAAGLAPGTSRVAYLIDYGAAGTIALQATGTAGDEAYAGHAVVLTLMVDLSTFAVPAA